jgi:exosortase family protein XrtM
MTRRWIQYLALFLGIFCALDYGYHLAQGTGLSHLLVDDLTVRPSVAIIHLLLPTASATASGNSLLSPLGRLNILEGCEGTEGIFLLIAAVLPYPTRWRFRLIGVVTGALLIYVLNLLRVVVLLASLRWHRDWFGALHGVIAPTAIVVAGCLFFLVWANSAAKSATGAAV